MYVKDLLSQQYGLHRVEQGGLRVITTLDLSVQKKAQEIVTQEVATLGKLNVGNGAAVITEPTNGEILAMVGSTDYFNMEKDGNVNVALTPQQPGSTIKVVTYVAALQNGFTAATLINDSPITYKPEVGPSYSPVNYDGRFHGMVPLRNALGNSYNVPAVRTLAKIGLSAMIEQAQKMGVTSWDNPDRYGLSLTLGGGELTMLEMASIYGSLASGGKEVEISPISEILLLIIGIKMHIKRFPKTSRLSSQIF
jgi:membrane peptidoglycan carboxypeptidase